MHIQSVRENTYMSDVKAQKTENVGANLEHANAKAQPTVWEHIAADAYILEKDIVRGVHQTCETAKEHPILFGLAILMGGVIVAVPEKHAKK
jgi:hypothetical protein